MNRLLFGDNQFFGINHMSEEKARSQAMQFRTSADIIDVLEIAYDEGITTFMCTTHEQIKPICDHVRANPGRFAKFEFYPCMPYAHKYANAVTEHGMMGAVKHFMPDGNLFSTALRGGMSLARKDLEELGRMLIDMEMKMFKGTRTPVIFLQNVVVDLLLGMGAHEAFRVFHDYVRDTYKAEAGFITMNLPMLADALESVGIDNPIICTNFNKIGFRTSGGLDSYIEVLKNRKVRVIAMSVYASGAISPREAIKWVAEQPNVQSIVFGASSRKNIRNTRELVDEFMPVPA